MSVTPLYGGDYREPEDWEIDPDGTPPSPPKPLFADVATFLEKGIPDPPRPVCLMRDDGHALFYAGKVNVLFGDPESGKSWIAYAAIAQTLTEGRRCAIVDVDHNGVREVITRLLMLGAKPVDLGDPERFRYYEPEESDELVRVVHELRLWRPAATVVDSIGEVLPMLGYSSNSPDDYTSAHRRVLTAISSVGSCVIAIDHMPKSEESRAHGQTGTMAKRRAVNGVAFRVTVSETFAPGKGGAASLTIHKDRPGGVRAICPVDRKSQPAGRFVMSPLPDGSVSWRVTKPVLNDPANATAESADVAELDALDPPPRSQRDVQTRMGWGGTRALRALTAWRDANNVPFGGAS